MSGTPRNPPPANSTGANSPVAAARSGWRTRARKLARRVEKIAAAAPITVRGLLLIGLAGLALWLFGFGSLDLLLFVIGVAGLALFGIAALLISGVSIWLARLARERRGEQNDFECGSLLRTGFRLPALRWCPLVQISWSWATPQRVSVTPRLLGNSLYEEVVARHRALQPALTRRFSVQDPFGLCRTSWELEQPGEVLLLPDVGRLRQSSMIPSLAPADGNPNPAGAPEGDRMEIRPYVPGDSVRNIVWGWYAKTRQLVVRTRERSIDRSRRIVAYLVAGEGDEPAAAAARVALEQGALGDEWAFGADGTPGMQTTLEDALRAVARSGSLGSEPRCGLQEFMRQASVEGDVHCIVFAAAAGGPWVKSVLAAMREFPASMSFVLGTDGINRARVQGLWRRLVLLDATQQGTPAESVGALVRLLSHGGARVVVADRINGRYYAEGASQALGATA